MIVAKTDYINIINSYHYHIQNNIYMYVHILYKLWCAWSCNSHIPACPGHPGCLGDLQWGLRGLCCNGVGRGYGRDRGGTGDVTWKRLKMVDDMEEVVDLIWFGVWMRIFVDYILFVGGKMILRLLSGMGFFVHVIILVLGLSLQFLRVGSGAGTRQWLGFTKAEMDRICPKHCVIWLRPTAVFLHWDFSFIIFANLRKTWHMTRGCDECSFFLGDVFNIQYVFPRDLTFNYFDRAILRWSCHHWRC